MTKKPEDKKPFTTRQDPALIKRVKRWAIDHDLSLQDMVALALEELMKKRVDQRGRSTKEER